LGFHGAHVWMDARKRRVHLIREAHRLRPASSPQQCAEPNQDRGSPAFRRHAAAFAPRCPTIVDNGYDLQSGALQSTDLPRAVQNREEERRSLLPAKFLFPAKFLEAPFCRELEKEPFKLGAFSVVPDFACHPQKTLLSGTVNEKGRLGPVHHRSIGHPLSHLRSCQGEFEGSPYSAARGGQGTRQEHGKGQEAEEEPGLRGEQPPRRRAPGRPRCTRRGRALRVWERWGQHFR